MPYVLLLGEDEIAQGLVSCKDMAAGEQKTLPLAELIPQLREALAARAGGELIEEN